jgi:hypothetical protein
MFSINSALTTRLMQEIVEVVITSRLEYSSTTAFQSEVCLQRPTVEFPMTLSANGFVHPSANSSYIVAMQSLLKILGGYKSNAF